MSKVKEPICICVFTGMDAFTGRLFSQAINDLSKIGNVVVHQVRQGLIDAHSREFARSVPDWEILARGLTDELNSKFGEKKKRRLKCDTVQTCWSLERTIAAVAMLEARFGSELNGLLQHPAKVRVYSLCERYL